MKKHVAIILLIVINILAGMVIYQKAYNQGLQDKSYSQGYNDGFYDGFMYDERTEDYGEFENYNPSDYR